MNSFTMCATFHTTEQYVILNDVRKLHSEVLNIWNCEFYYASSETMVPSKTIPLCQHLVLGECEVHSYIFIFMLHVSLCDLKD